MLRGVAWGLMTVSVKLTARPFIFGGVARTLMTVSEVIQRGNFTEKQFRG